MQNSKPISHCQLCNCKNLESLLFLGFIPPVNEMLKLQSIPNSEIRFPLELLRCNECGLVQIGYEVDPNILFPHTYPYLSGTTKILKDNFNELANDTIQLLKINSSDLIIDIGANDGSLLMPFFLKGIQVLGIEPSQAADVAKNLGIRMVKDYFSKESEKQILTQYGKAKIITATNVFAHISNIHEIVESIKSLLQDEGVFISESHYLLDLVETLQYDTIYHEHLRYYSVDSLIKLFKYHGMEVFKIKKIPTHGGSIRVYSSKKGNYPIDNSVEEILKQEKDKGLSDGTIFKHFKKRVINSKLKLLSLIETIKSKGERIYGIGSPSRSSTIINYIGLDDGLIDSVMEVSSSHKLQKYIPGTRIPVLDEENLINDQPEYALLFSWHISEELIANLRRKGFKGKFIIPLPFPKIVE